MDGPSTNWKLYDELSKDRANSDPDLPELINVGSCGLHIIHGAFKRGAVATGWHIDNLLRSLWYLFSDAPAKKEDFMKISESKKFPLQFCATRWLEDIAVAERAILIWPDVQKFITQICAGSKSKIPKSHSFTTLQGMTSGPSCSSKATVLLYNCKSTSTISGSISKRKTNATFHGRISL